MFSQDGFAGGYLKIMKYPHVIEEFETIKELQNGKSIARFGDGEIKLILGRDCVSQKHVYGISEELAHILHLPSQQCLTGIMNLNRPTAKAHWEKYKQPKMCEIYNLDKTYYSSFITRPDSLPHINTPEYWAEVVKLWAGKRVLLVTGGRSSALRPDTMPEAQEVLTLTGPQEHAYEAISDLEEQIVAQRRTFNTVILCLGPTATCLAWRLGNAGIHALDLGHIAMFYRRFLKGEPPSGYTKK